MSDQTAIAIIVVLLVLFLYRLGLQPVTPAAAQPPSTQPLALSGLDERQTWAYNLATRLGNPQPSVEIIAFIVAWTKAEDVSGGAFERHNPLNTSQAGYGETATINSDGVKSYPDYESGMSATIATITEGAYTDLLAGIQTNNVQRALAGLYASPWGTNAANVVAIYPGELQRFVDAPVTAPAAPQQATGSKSVVTEAMSVSAGFYDTGAAAWNGGIHGGVDYSAPHGSPVYMPFDCAYMMTGHYDDAARMGDYLMCHLMDGYEYYSGHLEHTQPFTEGHLIPAGTLIGFTNQYDHTHIQLRDTGGTLIDFQDYYAIH